MNRLVQRGSTDVSTWVQLLDAAGDYVTGLTYSDVAITARRFLGGRLVSEIGITPAELTAIDDAHADGGFVEDPSRKRYRVDLTDACLATGLDSADKVELKVTASGVVGNTSEELTLVNFLPWQTTGERTITVHVTNASGGADLAGCSVTIKDSANLVKGRVDSTDVNGEGEVYVNDGPYTVVVSRDGFITKGQAVTVSSNTSVDVVLSSNTPEALGGVEAVNGYFYALDENNETESGVSHLVELVTSPSGYGKSYENEPRTVLSDSNGLVTFSVLKGARYRVTRGKSSEVFTIPSNPADPYALPNIKG